jgi:putative CocE/NonD family hydrolase
MITIIQETASMLTRDGVRLDADIYRPEIKENLPVLLMRQPYGREIASTVVYAHPSWYAECGYMVVIQDVRGRGTSEGQFDLFTYEIEDGLDTIEWVARLPGSNGKVGMYGFSYQGMTQLYAAIHRPAVLKVLAPAMVAYDLYADWAYENGAFCLQANLGWAIQLAAETARLRGDEAAYRQLYEASRNLPLNDKIPANPAILQDLAPDSFYHTWLNNHQPGKYWEERSPKYLLENVDLPMLHIGGWFDPYLRGTLNLYRAMVAKSEYPQHLIIGPWGHLPWGRKLGAIDYGMEAQNPIDEIQVAWFDYFLKDEDNGIKEEASVCLWEMGSNRWRYFDKFPDTETKIYYLASDGLAGMREDSGMLWEYEAADGLEEEEETDCATDFTNYTDRLVHDPWRPVPALGGHAAFPSGSFDRSSLDCRSDILTYTSAPVEDDLHLVGEIKVIIYCEANRPSFDLCAVLSTVTEEGKVFNFAQGYLRVDDATMPITITLQATCIRITSEQRLRLSLSAACFPAYPVNPGNGKLPHEASLMEMEIITLAVHSGGDYPSQIQLLTSSE